MRLLIIAGHSGQLQSATALATACHAAHSGKRVLIASVGPAHVLGSLLGQQLGPRPLELEPNLAAIEVVARDEIGQGWDTMRPTIRSAFASKLRDLGSEELPSFPGMDAVGALMIIEKAARSGRFDLVVFDGPTIDTLIRTLALPDTIRWLVRLLFGLDRGAGRSRTSIENALLPTTLIPANALAPVQDLRVHFEEQRARLEGIIGTRVRVVMPAEELMLPGIAQTLSALGLHGAEVDGVIGRGSDEEVSEATRALFEANPNHPRPDLIIDSLAIQPTDRETWAQRGAQLYARRRGGYSLRDLPYEMLAHSPAEQQELRIHVPFLDSRGLDIAVANEDVVIRSGAFRRHVLLPGLVAGGRLRARVEGEILRLWVE